MLLDALLREIVQGAVEAAVRPLRDDLDRLRQELAHRAGSPFHDDAMLSTSQAAELMAVSPDTIRQWLGEDRLTPHGTRRALRVSRRELLALRPDQDGARVVDLDCRAQEILARGHRREST